MVGSMTTREPTDALGLATPVGASSLTLGGRLTHHALVENEKVTDSAVWDG